VAVRFRMLRGFDVGSEHNLVITKAKLKLNSTGKKKERTVRYQESTLRATEIRQQFKIDLRNGFSILQKPDPDDTGADNIIKQRSQKIKNASHRDNTQSTGAQEEEVSELDHHG